MFLLFKACSVFLHNHLFGILFVWSYTFYVVIKADSKASLHCASSTLTIFPEAKQQTMAPLKQALEAFESCINFRTGLYQCKLSCLHQNQSMVSNMSNELVISIHHYLGYLLSQPLHLASFESVIITPHAFFTLRLCA